MTTKKAVHLLQHHCGPQECGCEPICNVSCDGCEATGIVKDVTCKRCLGALAARDRRRNIERTKLFRSLEAWAEECAS